MNLIQDFNQFYNDDWQRALTWHLYLGALIGFIHFNIQLILILTKHNDNKQLADFSQDGLSENGKTAIENTIEDLNLQPYLARMNLPKQFKCKISNKLILNPVFNSNGDTYDRESYIKYLAEHDNIDPITNTIQRNITLRPNIALRTQILDFLTEQSKVLGSKNTSVISILTRFKASVIGSIPFFASAQANETSAFSSNQRRPLLS